MRLRLYIARGAPNSVLALANLTAILAEHLKISYKLETIDVLKFPLRAIADNILVTPHLTKLSPGPVARIVGNLSDRAGVLLALGIKT